MYINGILFNADIETILEELVTELRLNDIHYLQKMKPSGDDIMVSCPYHHGGMERKPSAGIRKSDGVLHCFSCNVTHSLQEVISYCFGYEDDMIGAFGWKWLNRNFATISVEERKDVKLDLVRNDSITSLQSKSVINTADSNGDGYVTEEELDSYRYYHPYWTKRGITDEHIIELFDLGYDKSTECITMPVRDIKGNCLFVARRSVKTKWFNIPQSAQKPLYGLYEALMENPTLNEIIVCEGMIDAITVHVFDNSKWGVALFGLGSDTQFKQLRELPCRKIILATDADEAGMKARERIRKNVPNKIITEYVWDRSMAKDINDMTREQFLSLEEVFA